MLDKRVEVAYSIDVAILNRHNAYSIITEKLQEYTDLTEELTIRQPNTVCVVSLVLATTGIAPHKNKQQVETAESWPCFVYDNAESSNS